MSALGGLARLALVALLAGSVLGLPRADAAGTSGAPEARGRLDAERSGTHDANNMRTIFWNYGMVGDYPPNPSRVNLKTFHSAEVPKGSGMNYSDGVTPFVLAKIRTRDGQDAYIMETGFRERQGLSPRYNRVMRFEPRPGFFQADPRINEGRSPAISNDRRTWPDFWPDKAKDADDPGWPGSWNGYFGKRAAADQESYMVMDDDYYDAWSYFPDSTDPTRLGLGLRVAARGFQWANPQAGNVIFWHYDITNESTTDYDDNVVFGLYMDAGVGGSGYSCDGIYESDDDNAFWDRSYAQTGSRLNLVYTWDRRGHGVDLSGPCGPTGYLGYAYLETPGNPFDGRDNDDDGIRDERRDGGPGTLITDQTQILAHAAAVYDTNRFSAQFGPLQQQPAYLNSRWWTGDEDMDWEPEFSDVGADGVAETQDLGEGDGIPTLGEPNFDRTDLNESDQIGLTGFKLNRIRQGQGNPDPNTDGIVFFTDNSNWPARLWSKFTDPFVPGRFDSALAANYNLGFLFASGPFKLKAGQTERFSLALAYGADLEELRTTVGTVQQIYDGNYQFAVPPAAPTVVAEPGDGRVRLSWDEAAERSSDPVKHIFDFEGYRIYRSTDPTFRDVEVITTARGNDIGLRKPLIQFDLADGRRGYTRKTVEGVSNYLGDDGGIVHTWTDSNAVNGQEYFYSVTAFDYGFEPTPYVDRDAVFPSENSIAAVSRTLRGGYILQSNVVRVRPNPRVFGYEPARTEPPTQSAGAGLGTASVLVVGSDAVPDGHVFQIAFAATGLDSVRATSYSLIDSTVCLSDPCSTTTSVTLFRSGLDLEGRGIGPAGSGLLPVIATPAVTMVDGSRTGWAPGYVTNTLLTTAYQQVLSANLRRPGYPDSVSVIFEDTVQDTSIAIGSGYSVRPAKFKVIAHTPAGERQLDFRFRDNDPVPDGTLSLASESFDILTYASFAPDEPQPTWRVQLDLRGQGARGPIQPPRRGDRYELRLSVPFGVADTLRFTTTAQSVNRARASAESSQEPYVVPNPYIEAAGFEPGPFSASGRGDRRIEFRGLPQGCTVRIYTVRGALVQALRHDGSTNGFVAWDLRTKDNLDVAPGLYVFHVETPGMNTHVGKFAVVK